MKTNKFGKWAVVGLIVAALAAPLTTLAAPGNGPRNNIQVAQNKQDCPNPDCPNDCQQLRDGSGRTRNDSMHQNRGAGLRNGTGPRYGAGNRGPAQN
jgi:hypothetical protein